MRKIDIGKTKKIFLFFRICIFLLLIFSNSILAAEKPPILRIGIFLNQDEVNISGDGPFKIYNLETKELISEEKNKIIKILPHEKGIKVLGIGVYSGLLNIIPVGDTKIMVIINGQKYRYRGRVEVAINKDCKKLDVINVIGIEEYLYGVMKKEISPHWPIEVLKAQAIAARTFAIFNMNKYIDKGYNICASTNSQVYGGVNHEDPLTNKVVDETRGLIMVYKGKPINAVYHSDSGGYTEDSENVWGEYVPYLRSVESKYEEIVSPPHHNWVYSITNEDLVDKLNKQGYKINSVLSIEPVEKTKTGRVSKLAFISENNEVIHIKTNDFRKMIGPDLIRSALFKIKPTREESNNLKNVENKEATKEKQIQKESIKDILEQKKEWTIDELIELMEKRRKEKEKEKEQKKEQEITTVETVKTLSIPLSFLFSGSGNGHGVGMSQWGAYGMALQGYKYQDILKYYYQGISIIKKY